MLQLLLLYQTTLLTMDWLHTSRRLVGRKLELAWRLQIQSTNEIHSFLFLLVFHETSACELGGIRPLGYRPRTGAAVFVGSLPVCAIKREADGAVWHFLFCGDVCLRHLTFFGRVIFSNPDRALSRCRSR
jgi:hypothetical protein